MMVIERITPEIVLVFKDVRLRALRESPLAFGSTYAKECGFSDAQWVERAGKWSDGKSAGFLAMEESLACGIAAGFIDAEDATKAHLVSMWVSPDCRGKGVGRRLVGEVIDWARATGARSVGLMVVSNNAGAIGFYERLGFSMTGRVEAYPNDPGLVEFEMVREVSAS